jgi:hypothetical protein
MGLLAVEGSMQAQAKIFDAVLHQTLSTRRPSQPLFGESVPIDVSVYSHSKQYSKLSLVQGRADMALER